MTKPTAPEPSPRLRSVAEVARDLGLSTKTIRRLIAARELAAYKIGRRVCLASDDVERFLAAKKKKALINRTRTNSS